MNGSSKRKKYIDTEDEYRVRFLGALSVDKSDLYLFVDDETHSVEEFYNLSLEEIAIAIRSASKNDRNNFLRTVKRIGTSKKGRKRFEDLYIRYFPSVNIETDPDFLDALANRFFTSTWPKNKPIYALSRREDEELMMKEGYFEGRLTRLKVFSGIEVPVDIARVILSFLRYDYDLISSVGIVSVDWFRCVLESWEEVSLNYHAMKIPLCVMKSVKRLRFETKMKSFEEILKLNHEGLIPISSVQEEPPYEYIFNTITKSRIRELDFTKVRQTPSSSLHKEKIALPNCEILRVPKNMLRSRTTDTSTPAENEFWAFLKNNFTFSPDKMKLLECALFDLSHDMGWEHAMSFRRLRTLDIALVDSEIKILKKEEVEKLGKSLENMYLLRSIDHLKLFFPRDIMRRFLIPDNMWKKKRVESLFNSVKQVAPLGSIDSWVGDEYNGNENTNVIVHNCILKFDLLRFPNLRKLDIVFEKSVRGILEIMSSMGSDISVDFEDSTSSIVNLKKHEKLEVLEWRVTVSDFSPKIWETFLNEIMLSRSLRKLHITVAREKEFFFFFDIDEMREGQITRDAKAISETLNFLEKKRKGVMGRIKWRVQVEFVVRFRAICEDKGGERRSTRLRNDKFGFLQKRTTDMLEKKEETLNVDFGEKKNCGGSAGIDKSRTIVVHVPEPGSMKGDSGVVRFEVKEGKLSKKKYYLCSVDAQCVEKMELAIFRNPFFKGCLLSNIFLD